MPTTSASSTNRLSSDRILDRLASADREIKLKAIREVKNQIIGNRTKKLSYIKLGAVPIISSILAEADSESDDGSNLLVQSAAALGSFACGVDAGVRSVLDSGAFPHLVRLLSSADDKVVDTAARSLRMIYQSKLAPKYDFIQEGNMEFLLSLLNSENENFNGLGASIIIHSCQTIAEQKLLCHSGALEKLIALLEGSINQRDASLESLTAIFKNNPEAVSKFVGLDNGKALSSLIELAKDRYPRTRLLACICLICVRNTSLYIQDVGIKTKLVYVLLELLDDPGQVGDEASFAFSSLIAEKEDLQQLAFEANAIDKLYSHTQKCSLSHKRFEGILLAIADLCSKLECCRSRFLSLQVLNTVVDALNHSEANVRTAACICLRNVSRSIKTLSAGHFMNEKVVIPLVRLLSDLSVPVQVAALGAISNIVVDFVLHKSTFIKYGGLKELVQLSKSMDSTIRLNALWALRNLVFLADKMCKQQILMELTVSSLVSLICDPEPSVQEQALAFVRNLVDGYIDCVEYAFADDGIIIDAIGRQLQNTSSADIGIQGVYVLCNIASGNEFHKEAVMKQLLLHADNGTPAFMVKFLQGNNSQLRTAALWVIVNLSLPSSPGAYGRVIEMHNCGIVSQIKSMSNDPCMDVKLRIKTALKQFETHDSST